MGWATEMIGNLGAVVGMLALLLAVFEYVRRGAQRRAEYFAQMRRHFAGNDSFRTICGLLESDSQSLLDVAFNAKTEFLGFFEEIALGINSRLIRKEVAHYMFGYYAIRCWESESFWKLEGGHEIDRNSRYWSLFGELARTMKERDQSRSFDSPRRIGSAFSRGYRF